MKYVVCVPDGCADEPLAALDEAGRTVVQDALAAFDGTLKVRPLGKEVYKPGKKSKVAMHPDEQDRDLF